MVLADLNYLEESSDSPELTVAILPRTGKVNLMSMESRLHVDMLEKVAALATQGCEQIHTILDSVVRQNTQLLKDSMLQ
jgi:exosome complex component RRP41